jgi:hypothetical protein
MPKGLLSLIIPIIAILLGSCAYHNEEDLYSDNSNSCDTSNVTYSGTVLPVLQASCLGCHATAVNAFDGGGVDLEDFESFKTRIGDGSFMGVITHSGGYPQMPKGGAKLDTCTVTKIKAWIDQGMKKDL